MFNLVEIECPIHRSLTQLSLAKSVFEGSHTIFKKLFNKWHPSISYIIFLLEQISIIALQKPGPPSAISNLICVISFSISIIFGFYVSLSFLSPSTLIFL